MQRKEEREREGEREKEGISYAGTDAVHVD